MKKLLLFAVVAVLLAGCVTPLYVSKMPDSYKCTACGWTAAVVSFVPAGRVVCVNGSALRFDESALKYHCTNCRYENLTYTRGSRVHKAKVGR